MAIRLESLPQIAPKSGRPIDPYHSLGEIAQPIVFKALRIWRRWNFEKPRDDDLVDLINNLRTLRYKGFPIRKNESNTG